MAADDPNEKHKPEGSFFSELRKRKVVQAAAIYGAVAWGVTEVVVTVVDQLFLPQWVSTLAVIFFVVGFPVAMFLAWTFDITAEGIRRTAVSSRRGTATIAASMVLLVAGTAGLFFLIKPSLQARDEARPAAPEMAPNSIAVLPFSNAGANPDDVYLIQGLSDELRDQLARVAGLRIAARSSSIAASEQGLDAFSASQKLGVAHLVEGTLRRQGNVMRVSVQLIEGASGLALWSKTFDRGPQELLNVQQEIAEAVVANVLPESAAEIAEPATRDPTANELMLLARHYDRQVRERQDVDERVLLEAVRLYRRVTEVDPGSALAHSRLAGALLYLGDLEAARAPIFQALSLAPTLSEVQTTLGEYYWAVGRTKDAGDAWGLAVEQNPNNPDALRNLAWWNWTRINADRAKVLYQRALEVDRLNLERYAELGMFLALESHIDEARELVDAVEALFEGAAAFRVLADLHDYLGDVDKAIAWTLRARALEPDNPAHTGKLAEYFADIGDVETALALDPNGIGILFKARRYEQMIDIAEFAMIEEPQNLRLRSILAVAHNAMNNYESALQVLQSTGLPDSVLAGWRTIEELDGFRALVNALYGLGEVEVARELAQTRNDWGRTVNFNWWGNLHAACEYFILGNAEKAHVHLDRARQGRQLPWDPVLKDSPCFDNVRDDPLYQATVRYYDDRRAELRERLPFTLAEFGVSL